jgi:MFS family permease
MIPLQRLPLVRSFVELRREFEGTVLVLAAGDFVAQFGWSLVVPFFSIYLTSKLGASVAQAGLVVGLYAIASIVSSALGGWLADRIGRKRVMLASSGLTALVIASMGQVNDLASITGLAVGLGFVSPPFIPASRAAVADVVPQERRPRAYALLGVAASAGWIAGPSVGAGLSVFGYPILFGVAGLIIGAYTVILTVGLRETRPAPQDAASGDSMPAAEPPGASPKESSQTAKRGPGRVGVLAAFLLLAVLVHAVTPQWVVALPVHAFRELGISTATWGLLFALNGIIVVIFQLRISSVWEHRSKPGFIALGMAVYLGGYLVVAAIPGASLAVPMLVVTVILVSLGEILVFPVEPAFVADLSPARLRGRYQGFLGAAAGLGFAIGAPVGGAILDAFRGSAAWLVFAAVAAVAGLGLAWLGRSGAAQPLARAALTSSEPRVLQPDPVAPPLPID